MTRGQVRALSGLPWGIEKPYTLTSGIFGTDPRLGGVAPPSPRGPGGLARCFGPPPPPPPPPPRRLLFRRSGGIFSGFGVTGPSRNSKPSLSSVALSPVSPSPLSSLITTPPTWRPFLSFPNTTSPPLPF